MYTRNKLSDLSVLRALLLFEMDYHSYQSFLLNGLAERAATYVVATAPQPDHSQDIAKVTLQTRQQQEAIRTLVDLVAEVSQANVDLKLECKEQAQTIEFVTAVIALTNPATTVLVAPLD